MISKIFKNRLTYILTAITVSFISCTDYLDVDTDTDNPKTASLNFLLTETQSSLAQVGDYNVNSGSILATYVHSATSREEEDQYGVKVDNINMRNDWDEIYFTLNNLKSLIQTATNSNSSIYLGIAQIEKAYLMSVAVDLWGDVPFSEASKLTEGIVSPKFDNQKLIYSEVFKLIDQGKVNILANQGAKPKLDDLFYAGNSDKWVRFANTLKLKLYNQTRLTSDFDTSGFNALIAENKFFTNETDDFQLKHQNVISPTNERNRYYQESYESSQFGSYQSPWFYEVLKGVNPNIHTGNKDPRIPYYFCNQLKANVLPGVGLAPDPNADYWEKSTGFFSIRFGSTGPNRDRSAENDYTYPGIFPCGGKYDDGNGGVITGESGAKGVAPRRILTYAEMLFIQAELINSGKLSGSAVAKFEDAVKASMKKVDEVVMTSGTSQTVPTLATSAATITFISNLVTEFNAANSLKQLELIMTQKWVATFGDPLDQYNDYRRTGFPILADPNSSALEYQLNNADAYPLSNSTTILNGLYQLSFFWPQSELNANQNAPNQKNPTTYKIFWDN